MGAQSIYGYSAYKNTCSNYGKFKNVKLKLILLYIVGKHYKDDVSVYNKLLRFRHEEVISND